MSGTILYGQGNFIFRRNDDELSRNGLLVEIQVEKEAQKVIFHPIKSNKKGVVLSNDQKVITEMNIRSKQIEEEGFIDIAFKSFVKKNLPFYFCRLHGSDVILKIMNRITNGRITNLIYSRQSRRVIGNLVECESHKEIIIYGCKYMK